MQVAADPQPEKSDAELDAKADQWKHLYEEARARCEAGQERIEARLAKLEDLLQSSILNKTSTKASACDITHRAFCSMWLQS